MLTGHDILFLHELKLETTIGLHAWEKRIKQIILLDFDFKIDTRKIALSNDLRDSVDYDELALKTKLFLSEQPFELIEVLAEKLAQFILDTFHLAYLRLQVRKPGAVPNAKTVGVIIERTREAV